MFFAVVLVCGLAAVSALPAHDPVLSKFGSNGPRYTYEKDADGTPYLVDSWLKLSDAVVSARYNPNTQNAYHLFTRANPSVSRPIVQGNAGTLQASGFSNRRRTIVLIHGWRGSATSEDNRVLVPAFLAAEDVNVLVVDWSAGAGGRSGDVQPRTTGVVNAQASGPVVAGFINWLNSASGSNINQYHILGFSLGGHKAGIVSRNLNGNVPYLTGLDPGAGWDNNNNRLRASDSRYTEVIHTEILMMGTRNPLGHVDFYPNGGSNNPGCIQPVCDHNRSFHFMAESVRSGGFTGRRCNTHWDAMIGDCFGATLRMGGRTPKTGSSGIYYLRTNRNAPFSQG